MNMNFVSIESFLPSMENAPDIPVQQNPDPNPPKSPNAPVGALPPQTPGSDGCVTVLKGEKGVNYYCNIGQVVEGCQDYIPLLHVLHTATENDSVTLNIFSYGGSVETGCHIIAAMQNCKANVITYAYGMCASIAAVIWCFGKERHVSDNSTIMFHMPSGGCFGKTADNEEESHHIQEYFRELLSKITKGILSEQDLEKVVTCRNDIFIPASQINETRPSTEDYHTTSIESLELKRLNVPYYNEELSVSCEGLTDCPDGCSGEQAKPCNKLFFTRVLSDKKDGSAMFTFYLNVPFITRPCLNEFCNRMLLVAEKDSVLIHCPADTSMEIAECIVSAMQTCKSQDITICAPYVLSLSAAYIAASAPKRMATDCGYVQIALPHNGAFGKLCDAENALKCNRYRILHCLQVLSKKHFIQSDTEMEHIVQHQGIISLHGDKYKKLCLQA